MIVVEVKDSDLQAAAKAGMDEFVGVFVNAILEGIGGEITAQSMGELNADQITLLAYNILHEEVMDGGFVQLIHNGYGGFLFINPFAKALKGWGLKDLASLVNKGGRLYRKFRGEIECECSDEEFMALFEKYPAFDELDDIFVENEEQWTADVAHYIDENIEKFCQVVEK